jgi:hypothetical protein
LKSGEDGQGAMDAEGATRPEAAALDEPAAGNSTAGVETVQRADHGWERRAAIWAAGQAGTTERAKALRAFQSGPHAIEVTEGAGCGDDWQAHDGYTATEPKRHSTRRGTRPLLAPRRDLSKQRGTIVPEMRHLSPLAAGAATRWWIKQCRSASRPPASVKSAVHQRFHQDSARRPTTHPIRSGRVRLNLTTSIWCTSPRCRSCWRTDDGVGPDCPLRRNLGRFMDKLLRSPSVL